MSALTRGPIMDTEVWPFHSPGHPTHSPPVIDNHLFHNHHSPASRIDTSVSWPAMDSRWSDEDDDGPGLDTDWIHPRRESGKRSINEGGKFSVGRALRGLKKFRVGLTQVLSHKRHGNGSQTSGLNEGATNQAFALVSTGPTHPSDQDGYRSIPFDPGHDHGLQGNISYQDGQTLTDIDPLPLPGHLPSPVPAELRLSADYLKMGSHVLPFQEISLTAYISRLREFFKNVHNLPWIASRPTVDYYPGQSGTQPPPEPLSPPNWYALLHRRPIDLMSSGSSSPMGSPGDVEYHQSNLPNPEYIFEPPTSAHVDPEPQTYPSVYPQGYFVPQPLYVQTGYLPSNVVQIYGPPMPNHVTGHQYPYPIPWPLPPTFS